MTDSPEDSLEETRAALAPTLEATAAILPWLARPRPPRFDSNLNQRWIEACKRMAKAWSDRYGIGASDIRAAVFALYGIALETADAECLRLGEALASATDQLEIAEPPPRLIAALTASIECLAEPDGLENIAFGERARHFAERLEATIAKLAETGARSPVLDHLFAEDARERIEHMYDALAVLPPDAYALKMEAGELALQAEYLELYGIMDQARELAAQVGKEINLDSDDARARITVRLQQLTVAIAAVDG